MQSKNDYGIAVVLFMHNQEKKNIPLVLAFTLIITKFLKQLNNKKKYLLITFFIFNKIDYDIRFY